MSYLFRGQRSNEEVILVVRHHPLILLRPILISVCVALVPFGAYIFLVVGSLLGGIAFLCWLYAFWHAGVAIYGWYNSILLLTNERVIVVRQRGILKREITECALDSIQQISHKVEGVLRTLFGYGHMEISLGSQNSITVHNFPSPYDIQQEILRAAAQGGHPTLASG
jgi:uncharacterized membrane protein YdbT with pleckstrin-like domain